MQCNGFNLHIQASWAMHWDCIAYATNNCAMQWNQLADSCVMHWDSFTYDKMNCAVIGIALLIDKRLVVQGIGIALLMIRIVVQSIGIKIAYD